MGLSANIKIPGHVQPIVDVLGVEGAVVFLLQFGGAGCHLSRQPTAASRVAKAIGLDKARALAERFDVPPNLVRFPTAKPFIAAVLFAQNKTIAEIARTLHTTETTVRAMLSDARQAREAARRTPDSRQLSIFDDTE